jgi:hypothetical protein
MIVLGFDKMRSEQIVRQSEGGRLCIKLETLEDIKLYGEGESPEKRKIERKETHNSSVINRKERERERKLQFNPQCTYKAYKLRHLSIYNKIATAKTLSGAK